MLGTSPQPQPFYDPNPHSLSGAYLGHSNTGFSPSSASLYPSYLYNHPAPTYHLPTAEHSLHNLSTNKDLFNGPLDFSKDFSRGGDYRSGEYTSQQSSPSLGSDTSSSPVYQPPVDSLYGAEVALLSQARYSHSEHHYKPALEHTRPLCPALRDQGREQGRDRRDHNMMLWSETEVRPYTETILKKG